MSLQPSTAALAPSASASTKRLSTFNKSPTSPTRAKATLPSSGVKDVVSPGELCGFVDTLLSQLETRFDEMSEQVLGRMNEMSDRIDSMENTIQELMSDDFGAPITGSGSADTPTPAQKR